MKMPFDDPFFRIGLAVMGLVMFIIYALVPEPEDGKPKPDANGFYELPKKDNQK